MCSVCICVCAFFAGRHLALHPTQALGRLGPAATLPRSAPTPANPPSTALSAAAALGRQECACLCVYLTKPGCLFCTNAIKKKQKTKQSNCPPASARHVYLVFSIPQSPE